jgi:lichenan operon transcriptional antiterminator
LGIPEKADNDASLLIKIYDEIIKIASDQKQVEELAGAASYEDFTKCLEQASSSSSILGM